MKLSHLACLVLAFPLFAQSETAFGATPQGGVGIVIGRIEVRYDEERRGISTQLGDIEVDIVREETVRGEVVSESMRARTSETGVFMAPLSSVEGMFRIARLKLPASNQWIDISRVSVEGDVLRYGAAYFHRFSRVVALNPLIYEESSEGQSRLIMVVTPFADMCLNFLAAFPDSPWKGAVEQARILSLKAGEPGEPEAGREEVERREEAPPVSVRRPIKALLSREAAPKSESATPTIVITTIVLVILAILVGLGGRRRHHSQEREIDITEIEQIDTERERQRVEDKVEVEGEGGEEEIEDEDQTEILSEKEGWFLREFRRARVRIHWKKYDSATVSLEKTTRFMEEHIDRLREKKELYTLVLHYSYLGRCYLESGRYNDALRAFKRGIELNEYNSRMCEMGLADTLDAITRAEEDPKVEALGEKYPRLSSRELESIMIMSQSSES